MVVAVRIELVLIQLGLLTFLSWKGGLTTGFTLVSDVN